MNPDIQSSLWGFIPIATLTECRGHTTELRNGPSMFAEMLAGVRLKSGRLTLKSSHKHDVILNCTCYVASWR